MHVIGLLALNADWYSGNLCNEYQVLQKKRYFKKLYDNIYFLKERPLGTIGIICEFNCSLTSVCRSIIVIRGNTVWRVKFSAKAF